MRQPRHMLLEGGPPEGVRRFITQLPVTLSLDGDKPQAWVTVTRTASQSDPYYGDIEITRAMLAQMLSNFDKRTYGQDIFLDVSHRSSDGAAGKFLKLAIEGAKLRGLVEFTPYGVEAHKNRGFCYLSAEYHENWKDPETGEKRGALLMGAGLTIRPRLKGLDPFELAEPDGSPPTLIHPDLQTLILTETHTMWQELIARLRASLATRKLAEPHIAAIILQGEQALAKITDRTVAETVITALENAGKQLAEAIAAGQQGPITLQVSVPTGGLDEAAVKRLMDDTAKASAAAAKLLADTGAARVKLLGDTINAAAGIPDQDKRELVASVQDLVGGLTEDQVRALAATQIAAGNRLVAARQLAAQGFSAPLGNVHITVDSSNEIKALQDEVDKRLFRRMSAAQRYRLSDGAPLAANKLIVEEALAQFDALHGRRLHEESKLMKRLAAGDSLVSDVAVPVSFERTVLREHLFQLTGLALCNVATDTFSAVVQLPYSYRDTAGAGVANVRKYEGQAIARAAVKQALEEARPIPQKIAFEVSDELRYLIGNGQINFDIVAENAANASRIIGEDSEQLIYNEHLKAADQFATADIVAEDLELQADDVKKVFLLAQWPVVRPKKVYDLQGTQVGATLYPITVTYGGVAREEYDGTGTQAAGTYYVLNHNLGEIYLVNQAGAIQLPANATAYTISYSYTANVHKWDMDLGALAVEKKWNDFLYRFGTRKTALEDRQFMASLATMSGVVRDLIGQAEQFGANFKREATDLDSTGNVGRIKDVPTWRSYAPGLQAGDQRVVIAERSTVRYRMLKPWQLGQLQDQKDANGRFTGKKEAYGDQFIVVHTPLQLKGGLTSMVLYSAAARVARVAP